MKQTQKKKHTKKIYYFTACPQAWSLRVDGRKNGFNNCLQK